MHPPVVDAHQHFWRHGSYQTSWMEEPPYAGDPAFAPLRRDFGPALLQPELERAGVSACITVEAADHPDENAALLANADRHPWIAGVVGWVPLARPEQAARVLDGLRGEHRFVGVRHLINVEPDPEWVLQPLVIEGLRQVAARGLVFDYVGILPQHLANLPRLADAVPGLRIVIDHLGKPPADAASFARWKLQLAAAARVPGVAAKISGLDVAHGPDWEVDDIRPAIDHALECFGPERLMLGSDWPVAILRGGYDKVWRLTDQALSGLSDAARERIRGGTAIETYRLQLAR